MQVLALLVQHTMIILLQIHMMPLFVLVAQVQAQVAVVALNHQAQAHLHQAALQVAVLEARVQAHLRAHQKAQAHSAPV